MTNTTEQQPIKRIAITPGEPAGIGPDLVIKIAQQDWPVQLIVVASRSLLELIEG